jgi:hypothetical protein
LTFLNVFCLSAGLISRFINAKPVNKLAKTKRTDRLPYIRAALSGWIAQKMKPYLGENATLGSLFDGIGGFPFVWQKTYGNGTARWASEIDEFPIAVTKRRFGEQ